MKLGIGYCSTLSAWLAGQGEGDALPEVRDFEEVLHWLRDLTPCILRADASAFVEEVYRKRLKYGLDAAREWRNVRKKAGRRQVDRDVGFSS